MNQSTIKKRYIAPAMREYRFWENNMDVNAKNTGETL